MADLVYCDWSDVEYRLSETGALASIDDLASAEDEILDEASAIIEEYLRPHYTPSTMVGNRWVKHATSTIAACIACERRGNPPPKSLRLKAEKLIEKMEAIEEGKKQVPGLVRRRTSVPIMSVPRVMLGHTGPRTVISRWRGTWRNAPQDYVQHRDPTEPPTRGTGGGLGV